MTYEANLIPVCDVCKEEEHELCKRCGIAYCKHFASAIDFHYCGNCLGDFSVVETIETKVTEYTDAAGNITSRKRQLARNLKLTGTDWLFAQYAIENLTDEELLQTIEYHRNIASMMLLERETRKMEKYKKLAGIKVRAIDKNKVDENGALKVSAVKATKQKTKKEVDQAAIIAAFSTLLGGANITPEQMLKAMAEAGKKK